MPIAPPLQAILQDLRQRKSGNPFTDLLVSLLLTLLTGFFTRLSELMERIKSGEYQPRPIAPRQEPAPQRPRRRTPRQNHRWPAEARRTWRVDQLFELFLDLICLLMRILP